MGWVFPPLLEKLHHEARVRARVARHHRCTGGKVDASWRRSCALLEALSRPGRHRCALRPHTHLPHRPCSPCWRRLADDSQWINGRRNDAGWLPSGLLPETTLGWIVTVLAIAGILVLLQRHAEPAFAAGGQQLGSASSTAAAGPLPWGRPPAAEDLASSREAREKREAFLRRFDNTEKRQ